MAGGGDIRKHEATSESKISSLSRACVYERYSRQWPFAMRFVALSFNLREQYENKERFHLENTCMYVCYI